MAHSYDSSQKINLLKPLKSSTCYKLKRILFLSFTGRVHKSQLHSFQLVNYHYLSPSLSFLPSSDAQLCRENPINYDLCYFKIIQIRIKIFLLSMLRRIAVKRKKKMWANVFKRDWNCVRQCAVTCLRKTAEKARKTSTDKRKLLCSKYSANMFKFRGKLIFIWCDL